MSCIGLPRWVKWCKSEGVKDKLSPHSYIFFGLPRGVKWCKSEGVKDKLPPNSYIVLPPLADQKRYKSGGLICLLPPHSYTVLPPLEAQCSPKRRKSFELLFPKKSSHCSPTLTSFWAEKFNPGRQLPDNRDNQMSMPSPTSLMNRQPRPSIVDWFRNLDVCGRQKYPPSYQKHWKRPSAAASLAQNEGLRDWEKNLLIQTKQRCYNLEARKSNPLVSCVRKTARQHYQNCAVR